MPRTVIYDFRKASRAVFKIEFHWIKIGRKKVLLFSILYLLIIIFTNILSILYLISDPGNTLTFLVNLPASFTFVLLPCSFFLPYLDGSITDLKCSVDAGVILVNVCLAALSFYLVFIKRIKFWQWVLFFALINFIVAMFIALRGYLLFKR